MNDESSLKLTMIRCSTLLIEYQSFRILTDPWFGMTMRGLPCFRKPGLTAARIGAVDLVLVSHLHPDHFDLKATRRLCSPTTKVVVPRGSPGRLSSALPTVLPVQPGDRLKAGPFEVTVFDGPHTGPGPAEVNYLLSAPGWGTLFFGGDSRFDSKVLSSIAESFAPVTVAALPVGGSRIFGVQTVMDPGDALKAGLLLGASAIVPIHEGGIWMPVPPASWHPGRSAQLERLAHQLVTARAPRIVSLSEGQSFVLPPQMAPSPARRDAPPETT